MPEMHRKKHKTSTCNPIRTCVLFLISWCRSTDGGNPNSRHCPVSPTPDPSTGCFGPSLFSSGTLVSAMTGADVSTASLPNSLPRLAPFLKFDMSVMLTLCPLLVLNVCWPVPGVTIFCREFEIGEPTALLLSVCACASFKNPFILAASLSTSGSPVSVK